MPVLALALLLAATGPRNLPEGGLQIHDGLSCPSEKQLRAAIAQRNVAIDGALQLEPASGGADVTWTIDGRTFSRRLALSANDCPAAAETVSLLVAAWQRQLPTRAASDPLSEAAKVKPPTPKAVDAGPIVPDVQVVDAGPPPDSITPPIPSPPDSGPPPVPIAVDAGPAPIRIGPHPPLPPALLDAGAPLDAGALAPPAPELDAGIEVAALEPTPTTEVRVEAPATPVASGPAWHLALGAEGLGQLGVDANAKLGTVGALIEVRRGERFAAQLDVAADSAQTSKAAQAWNPVPPATTGIVASNVEHQQSATLSGLARFHPIASRPTGALRLEGGLTIARLAIASFDYHVVEAGQVVREVDQSTYVPGFAVGAAWEERLGPVSFGFGPEFRGLLNQVDFFITHSDRTNEFVLTVPQFFAGLALDARANIF